MIEIVKIEETPKKTIKMCEMQPLQIARIVDLSSRYNDNIIMRTASTTKFEVIDLSNPGEGGCWTDGRYLEVELIEGDVILRINNLTK